MYKIDTDAIRNLSNLARNLTVDGKLTVPGGLDVIDKVKLGPSWWNRHLILGGKNREAVNGEEAHIHSTNGNLHLDSQNGHDIYLNHYTKRPVRIDGTTYINGLLKVNRTDAHPWNPGWGNGVHTWDLKVDASADINNLTVRGNFNLGLHLIKVKSGDNAYKLITNNSNESYNGNDWILTIAGFNIDWNNRDPGAMKLYCYLHNNLWHIRSEIEFAGDDSDVNILCIPRKYFNRVDHTGLLNSGAGT